jgi:D-sedoheptulose 7-phosphate isomerase
VVNRIRVLALDIDGVLTDGTASGDAVAGDGKRFSFQDVDAVTQVQRAGLTVALVTGETGPAVDWIAQRFGVERVVRGAKDKVAALGALGNALGVPLEAICYVGDGDRDAAALGRVGLGLAPANATPAAKAAVTRVLSRAGGAGAVAEAIGLLLRLEADATHLPALQESLRCSALDSLAAHQRLLAESLPTLAHVALTFIRALRSRHRILFFGNGGSAADAQHVAAELVGRFAREREPWAALALTTDTSILTAVGNDWEFAEIFARQVRAQGRPGDVVVGISTSGRSPNVLRGLEAGRALGAVAVGFTGAGGGMMRDACDVCYCAPAQATPRIQELHILAWHAVCEAVEAALTAPDPPVA